MLSQHRPGAFAPGGTHRAIELARDAQWQPPERRPWNSRIRLAVAAVTLASATLVHLSGVTQPTGLRPTFVLSGTAASIALDGGLAYVVRAGAITAYRLADGAVAWSRPMPGPAPNVEPVGDHRLLLSTLDTSDATSLQLVDAFTGAVDWASSARLVGLAGSVAVVTVVAEERDAEVERLAGLDLGTGDPVWTAVVPVWTDVARPSSTLRLREQAELAVDGTLAVRDLVTGQVRARTALPPGTMSTSLSIAGGVVVVGTGGGLLLAYDATDLRPLWRRPTPLIGYFSQFVACGGNVCHINDRGTVALDRATGKTRWQAPVRYRAQTVDDEHLFVSGFFHRSADSTGGVLDPAKGTIVHELSPWAALETLDVVRDDHLLVWRVDGQKRVVIGLFDAYTGHTSVVGRTDPEFGTPTCAAGDGYVLCAGERDVVGWPT